MNRFSIRSLSIGVALGLASVASTAAAQTPVTYSATLNGANESPPVISGGTGFALFVYSAAARTLSVNASFSGLTGNTTAAHLHCCTLVALTGTAGVASTTPTFAGFPLGVTTGAYSNLLDLSLSTSWNPAFITANGGTTATAEAALVAGLNAGKVYFNIHTSTSGGGEIRGFVTVVPEPSTVLLMAGGLVAVGVMARRRRGVLSLSRA